MLPAVLKETEFKGDPFWPLNPDVVIYFGDPIDQFLKMRSSPRWLLINKNLEIVSRDFDIRRYGDRERIEALLNLKQ